MKNNIEEDIKILKDKAKALNEHIKDYEESNCTGSDVYRAIKEEKEAIENILADRERLEKENNNIKKVLKRDIRECGNQVVSTQGNKQRRELTGAQRRHIASLNGRQNEARRILKILEEDNYNEDK